MRALPLVLPAVLIACAAREPGPEPVLEPRALAAHASEFFCARGRWPADVGELEAFPAPATPRTGLEAPSGTIPWALLRDATTASGPDGALHLDADLPAGCVAGQPPERPVALRLRVERPGCWPPRLGG
jgi:hypothetical protein